MVSYISNKFEQFKKLKLSMNIKVFINKLTEASIQFNNDLNKTFTLNDSEFLLLSIIFNQINILNSNAYILAGCIQDRLNEINVKVLIDLDVN